MTETIANAATTVKESNDKALEKINRFTRRPLKAEEVYRFPVILCDNEIDRDGEKFSVSALRKLAELYIGKTGIFNHDPKGENQTARIYETAVIADPSRKTADGEDYTYLKAWAYMVRTDSNADLIKEIDGGIKKEVSVGCAVSRTSCSICGRDRRNGCAHKKGGVYRGKTCFDILNDPTDAYEWSFVAVPAQRGAGVTKKYSEQNVEKSNHQGGLLDKLISELKRDIMKYSFLGGSDIPAVLTKAAIEKMEPEELISLKRSLETENVYQGTSELSAELAKAKTADKNQNQSFRV